MQPAFALPDPPLPGWITIRRVSREQRGSRKASGRGWMFRFVCSMCGGVGDARPTSNSAASKALDHVRSCIATGPLGPRELSGASPRLSLPLDSHYKRMEAHLRSTPQLRQMLDRDRDSSRFAISWRAFRRIPNRCLHVLHEVLLAAPRRMWAILAAKISARRRHE